MKENYKVVGWPESQQYTGFDGVYNIIGEDDYNGLINPIVAVPETMTDLNPEIRLRMLADRLNKNHTVKTPCNSAWTIEIAMNGDPVPAYTQVLHVGTIYFFSKEDCMFAINSLGEDTIKSYYNGLFSSI